MIIEKSLGSVKYEQLEIMKGVAKPLEYETKLYGVDAETYLSIRKRVPLILGLSYAHEVASAESVHGVGFVAFRLWDIDHEDKVKQILEKFEAEVGYQIKLIV